MKTWQVTPDTDKAKYIGLIEFQDNAGEWYNFEVLHSKQHSRIVFGSSCNVGFFESGYLEIEDGESVDEALSEMLVDLECYYNEGPSYVSRIVCNERM